MLPMRDEKTSELAHQSSFVRFSYSLICASVFRISIRGVSKRLDPSVLCGLCCLCRVFASVRIADPEKWMGSNVKYKATNQGESTHFCAYAIAVALCVKNSNVNYEATYQGVSHTSCRFHLWVNLADGRNSNRSRRGPGTPGDVLLVSSDHWLFRPRSNYVGASRAELRLCEWREHFGQVQTDHLSVCDLLRLAEGQNVTTCIHSDSGRGAQQGD